MPMYEYKCNKCDYLFEKYEGGRNAGHGGREACPRCGKVEAERVFSRFSACGGSGGSAMTGGPSGGGCGSGGFS